MSESRLDKTALELLQGRVACKLAEIHQMLVPGLAQEVDAGTLQSLAERHMESLAPELQEKLRLKAMVAFAELERLTVEMTHQLNCVGEEIRRVTRRNRAIHAYRQAPGIGAPGLASL